jgi:hypothetical protein
LGIGSLKDKDDVFVVEYGSEIDENGNRVHVRLMLITNEVAAAAKEFELKNMSMTSRLRKRYSSGIAKSVNALERIALFMGKKKNAKDGDIDSKIWYHFRTQAKRKGFAKLTLVEMYNLLRFLEPHDLARVQESSRALCFVAGQEALWSRLCTYRKQYPRINKLDQTAFQQWNRFATKLEGRVYVVSSSRIFFDMSLVSYSF